MSLLKHLGVGKETLEKLDRAQEEQQKLQRAIDRADSVFAELQNFADGVGGGVEQHIAELRKPENLYLRISDRMIESGITPKAWKKSWEYREELMDKAFQIMLEEMQVPDEIRKHARLGHVRIEDHEFQERLRSSDTFHSLVREGWDRQCYGDSSRFVSAVWDDERIKAYRDGDLEKAKLDLNKVQGGLYNIVEINSPRVVSLPLHHSVNCEDFEEGIRPVMLHALMIMEQCSLLEGAGTILNTRAQNAWRNQIVYECLGSESPVEGSIKGAEYMPALENSVDSIFESAEYMSKDFIKTYKKVNRAK